MRTRTAIGLILLVAPVLAAAPVPRESDRTRIRRAYGEPTDPAGDAKFAITGLQLTVTAGPGLRGLNPLAGLDSAPRTLKPVTGDFELKVRIVADAIPAGSSPASSAYTHSGGGGLILWADEANHLRLSRSQYDPASDSGLATSYNFRGAAGGQAVSEQTTQLPEADRRPVTLRLTRAGSKVSAAYSHDDARWTPFEPVELSLPDAVKVGVYVAHNFNKPAAVTFDAPSVGPAGK